MTETAHQFDVTTPDARKNSLEEIQHWTDSFWVRLFFPTLPILRRAWRELASRSSAASATKEIESQRKTAVEIIRAGKEHNVDELEITMSDQAGIGFGTNIDGFPIEFNAGTQGKITIKVKYK
jgi:hypothetical protein